MKTAFQQSFWCGPCSLSCGPCSLSLAEKAGLFSLVSTQISLRGVFPHSWEAQEPCLPFLPEPSQTCTVSCQSRGNPFPCGGLALHPSVWLRGSLSYRSPSLGLRQMRGSESAEGLCSWLSLRMATARAAPELGHPSGSPGLLAGEQPLLAPLLVLALRHPLSPPCLQ